MERTQAQNKVLQDTLKEVMLSLQEMNIRLEAIEENKDLEERSPAKPSFRTTEHGDGFNPTRFLGYVPKLEFLEVAFGNPNFISILVFQL